MGSIDFAHGTQRTYATRIVNDGVSRDEILRHSVGSHEPGSFFTVQIDQSNPMGALETAAAWGARHGGATVVLVCRLPAAVVRELERAGSLVYTDVPNQAVFRYDAFETVNRNAQWFIVRAVRGASERSEGR
jgi:hypothetical protein